MLPDDAIVPVILFAIPLPERIYETGLATDISRSVEEVFVYDPERKRRVPSAGTTDLPMDPELTPLLFHARSTILIS